ncbi:MAG: CRISPR-associated ring nuclease Csm6 [Exilibacterium sp.]
MSAQHYRRILVAVSGMSPQIITETFYGLCGAPQRRDHPWIPHEIHLITTEDGREQARLQLLEGKCHFQQFLQDYGIVEPPHFALDTIHVIRAVDGTPLADLRTPAENEAAADFITDKIREFTCDDGTELHVSLAGGRKTMGFYIGYALSLFGRPQDRLSHVLVNSEYESLKNFFYPTPEKR